MAPARPHRRIRITTALIRNLPHREPLCAPASLGIESKLIRVAGAFPFFSQIQTWHTGDAGPSCPLASPSAFAVIGAAIDLTTIWAASRPRHSARHVPTGIRRRVLILQACHGHASRPPFPVLSKAPVAAQAFTAACET